MHVEIVGRDVFDVELRTVGADILEMGARLVPIDVAVLLIDADLISDPYTDFLLASSNVRSAPRDLHLQIRRGSGLHCPQDALKLK